MTITVKDLFQFDSNFDAAKIRRLTGKNNFEKTDKIDLPRLLALNDKDLSAFVAKKEGRSFVNSITDDNMRAQVADASGVKNEKAQNNQNWNIPEHIPMGQSIFTV